MRECGTVTSLADDALVARASTRAAEVARILADLTLVERVAPLGRPVLIGSASFGLLLGRDIDVGVLCPHLDAGAIFAVANALFAHPRVKRTSIVDERGALQSMPGPENEGIYCGIRYLVAPGRPGDEWRIDLWFFPESAPRPELEIRDRLLAATQQERSAILRIKHELASQGRYGHGIHGIDIYHAVLDRGDTPLADVVARLVGGDAHADDEIRAGDRLRS